MNVDFTPTIQGQNGPKHFQAQKLSPRTVLATILRPSAP